MNGCVSTSLELMIGPKFSGLAYRPSTILDLKISPKPNPSSLLPAKYRVPEFETEICQWSSMPFTSSPTGAGFDHPVDILSTNQMFSLRSVAETKGRLDVKNSLLPSGEKNGTSS